MPIETVTPPTPKTAEPVIEPAKLAEPAQPVDVIPAAPAPSKKTGLQAAAEKIGRIAAGEKIEPEPAAAPVAKIEDAPAAADADSDDAIKKDVEAKTQKWEPGQKKAFTDLRYSERDARRQVKALEAKVAEADAKGKDTAALERKLAEAEAKLAEASKATAVDPTEVAAIKQERDAERKRREDVEKELEVAAVERTDEWANVVTKPKKSIEESVKALATKHEINPRTLQAALYGTDEEQTAAVEGLTGPEQTKFYSLAIEAQKIDDRAETLRTNAAEALTKINARRVSEGEQTTAAQRKTFSDAHSAEWSALVESLPILAAVEGTDETTVAWNKSLENAKRASGEVADLAPDDLAKVRARAAVLPNLVGALQAREATVEAQAKQIAELTTEVEKFRANRPGAETTPKDLDAAPVVKKDLGERLRDKYASIGLR